MPPAPIYFPKDEDDDIRSQVRIRQTRRHQGHRRRRPRARHSSPHREIRQGIRHPHRHPQPRPRRQNFALAPRRPKSRQGMDPRIGCCIDVGHTRPRRHRCRRGHPRSGPRLFNMHMKDLTDFPRKESQVAVGEGQMPVRDIFEALIATIITPAWSISNTKSTATTPCPVSPRASPTCAASWPAWVTAPTTRSPTERT